MVMPNFLIIGAAKSGTTALYHALKQHPQIYMSPVKEPRFFAFEGPPPSYCGPDDHLALQDTITDLRDYLKLFEGVIDQTAIGEASVMYLTLSHVASRRIKHYVPDCKLIAVLRHPAERAYSNFLHQVRGGGEPLRDFAQALAQENARREQNWRPFWFYRQNGLYSKMLQPYFARFSCEQIRIYLYEDWSSRPLEVLQDIFRFLKLDDGFLPDLSKRHNVSLLPRSPAAQAFLMYPPHSIKMLLKPLLPQPLRRRIVSGLQSLNLTKPPPLDPELRQWLTEGYRDDILNLQDLIGRDLSHWLSA